MSVNWKTFGQYLIIAIEAIAIGTLSVFLTCKYVGITVDVYESPVEVYENSYVYVSPIAAEPLGMYTITAYCSCEQCCGEWALNRPNGIVYGAASEPLVAGISVAALQGNLDLGDTVYIEDLGVRVVQDYASDALYDRYEGRLLDVYCDTHEQAVELAKSERMVWKIA